VVREDSPHPLTVRARRTHDGSHLSGLRPGIVERLQKCGSAGPSRNLTKNRTTSWEGHCRIGGFWEVLLGPVRCFQLSEEGEHRFSFDCI